MAGSALFVRLMLVYRLQSEYAGWVAYSDDNLLKSGDEVGKVCLKIC
ncbi:hypothetical protein AM1_3310 [Acaryochloris marina MBIC11017]|uniref:Uncharacterized protein n=1 Tax=Acaryochloris marina (strain MBIC 11017) TaxID=329726 RepID=B0BZ04_ACAM1|nr:hypothetical protein AM1_3310 [Acaryochloris marina MBIC11017]